MLRWTFEELVLPHVDAAFNYARWLTRSDADAEDLVQDACLRALRFFSTPRRPHARAWLLTIVRHVWYDRSSHHAGAALVLVKDDRVDECPDRRLNPEALVIQRQYIESVRRALEDLPTDFREVLVLREIEGLTYKEIAAAIGIPVGTVMSRLARGRDRLLATLVLDARLAARNRVS